MHKDYLPSRLRIAALTGRIEPYRDEIFRETAEHERHAAAITVESGILRGNILHTGHMTCLHKILASNFLKSLVKSLLISFPLM
jgi:hypothetical protein